MVGKDALIWNSYFLSKMMEKIKKLAWHIFSCGLPPDYDLEVLRKIILINLILVLASVFPLLLSAIAFLQDDCILCIVDFSFFLFMLWAFIYLRRTKNLQFVSNIGAVSTGVFFLFLIVYGGVGNATYVWTFLYPLITLFLLGARWGTNLSFLFLAITCLVFTLGETFDFITSYSIYLKIRYIPAYISIYVIALLMEKVREIFHHRLNATKTELEKTVVELEHANVEKETLITELRKTMKEIRLLQGILPICAQCKKIRDDKGYWAQVEEYITVRSDAQFSHSICPDCAKQLYPDFDYGELK